MPKKKKKKSKTCKRGRINVYPNGCAGGKSTSFQELLEMIESISSLMPSFQKPKSGGDKASSKKVGSPCKLYT